MKLRTTTPASSSKVIRLSLIVVCIVITTVFTGRLVFKKVYAQCSSISECDSEIAKREQEIEQFKVESDRLNGEVATLQQALGKLSNEKSAIQAQIDISEAQYNKLVQQIADTEKKILDNKDALGRTIADMYVDDDITPIEMLASSKNISDFIDKQEYRSSVRDQLTSTIEVIKNLKKQLETQKSDVEKVLADQKSQRDALVAKENEQKDLLEYTQGQEAQYQQMISDNQDAIAQAKAAQAAINARFNSSGGYTLIDSGTMGDYPWNDSNCPMWGYYSTGGSDGNGGDGHGYGCRQCASYVAWRFAKETGVYPSWGDAVNFTSGATSLGYQEGAPQAGSIAVMDPAKAGQYHGHVAWVETDPYVNSSGQTVIQVSQYNYDFGWGYGYYSLMELSVSAFDHYIHIK